MFSRISAIVIDYINNVLRLIGTKWILYFKCSLQPSRYESHFSIKIILRAALTCKTKQINTGSQMVLGMCTSIIRALFIQQAHKSSLCGNKNCLKKKIRASSLVISVVGLARCCVLCVRRRGLRLFTSCWSLILSPCISGPNFLVAEVSEGCRAGWFQVVRKGLL